MTFAPGRSCPGATSPHNYSSPNNLFSSLSPPSCTIAICSWKTRRNTQKLTQPPPGHEGVPAAQWRRGRQVHSLRAQSSPCRRWGSGFPGSLGEPLEYCLHPRETLIGGAGLPASQLGRPSISPRSCYNSVSSFATLGLSADTSPPPDPSLRPEHCAT